jgi:hypothetical protein
VAAAGSAQQRGQVLTPLSEGSLVPAFAHLEAGRRWTPQAHAVTAVPAAASSSDRQGADGQGADSAGWLLDGVKEPVLNGVRAEVLVVSARVPDGHTALFLVPGDAAGVVRDGYPTYDGGRAARIRFDSAPATALGDPRTDAVPLIEQVVAQARVAYCHEAVGAMDAALALTTDYLKSRKQFGVPLKTFQDLTFRAADMYVSLELARSLALWATLVLADGDSATAPDAASRAALQTSRAGRHIGQDAIQLHGGIGMTMEYAVGHYTTRLTTIDHLLGDGDQHLARLSQHVGDHGVVDPLAE